MVSIVRDAVHLTFPKVHCRGPRELKGLQVVKNTEETGST